MVANARERYARAMPAWVTASEEQLLLKVLEPTVERNKKNNVKVRRVSFYSSELKNVAQIKDYIESVAANGVLPGNEESNKRYFNSLSQFGLLSGIPSQPALTPLGDTVLKAGQALPADVDRTILTNTIDGEIFRGLLRALLDGADPTEKAQTSFREILHDAQLFVDALVGQDPAAVAADLDLLYFLQCIHSAGYEVRRFYRMLPADRAAFRSLWDDIASRTFPATAPSTMGAQTAYEYYLPIEKKWIQRDSRYRVASFLQAYLGERKTLGEGFPYLSSDGEVTFRTRSATTTTKRSGRLFVKPPPQTPTTPTSASRQRLITGCPGSGKSRRAEDDARALSNAIVSRTTFHSESSYFDFVGNYKPVPVYEVSAEALTEVDGSPGRSLRPVIDYRFVPGPFARALATALANADYQVVLIIEELNRANASAVFGDILQLLDRDVAGASRYQIEPPPDLAAFLAGAGIDIGGELRLPANLFLWATMNTADQGVLPLDSAFRRRWSFEYLGHTETCAYGASASVAYGGKSVSWDDFRASINDLLVSQGIHEDKLVGPYFLTEAEVSNPQAVAHKLFLYLWDDALRFSHEALSSSPSFSHLVTEYAGGAGKPLAAKL